MNRDRLNTHTPTAPSKCPICGNPVPVPETNGPEAPYPFCSKRCRTIDLGKWLGGDYTISRPIEQRDLEEGVE